MHAVIKYFYLLKQLVHKTENMVRERMAAMEGSHDFAHINRVRKMAMYLSSQEGGNPFIIEMAALLHDLEDWKYVEKDAASGATREWLERLGLSDQEVGSITTVIQEVSFRGAGVPTPCTTVESRIVQDADRLDAIGAIGIARAFAYGGSRGRSLYDAVENPMHHNTFEEYKVNRGSTLNHFHEKLLLLKDRMNTPSARRLAESRHNFMLEFLRQFKEETYF